MKGIDVGEYKLNQIEMDRVLAADSSTRLEYMIKRVADWEFVWTLKDNSGFLLLADQNGVQSVPLWPFAEYAQLSCTGIWSDAYPEAIPLDKFMDRWITGMVADRRMVAVFPTPNDKALVISPEKLKNLLDEALSDYE